MKVWLCKYGETIPLSIEDRKYRVGMLGEHLISYNNEVIWWTSNFDHGTKTKLKLPLSTYKGIKLKSLDGGEYKKNISLQRLLHNKRIGKKFTKLIHDTDMPDLIYTSMPTLDMAYRAAVYASNNNIKLVVDIRDLWPDVFKTLIPFKFLRRDIIFFSMTKKLKYILNQADLVIAPTQAYLEWAKSKDGVILKEELVVPFGYHRNNSFCLSDVEKYRSESFEVTFAGTVSVNFDLETILEAAKILESEKIKFNIIGSGDKEKELRNKYGHLQNVHFWGWCDANKLHEILSKSSIGIAPYLNHENFIYNIPNKPYEYMAYGLPIFTCLSGATLDLLNKYKLGISYKEGDFVELASKILQYKNGNIKTGTSYEILKTFEENFSSNIVYDRLCNEMKNMVSN